jgi:hypothetical protein
MAWVQFTSINELACELSLNEIMAPTVATGRRPETFLLQGVNSSLEAGIVRTIGGVVEATIEELAVSSVY